MIISMNKKVLNLSGSNSTVTDKAEISAMMDPDVIIRDNKATMHLDQYYRLYRLISRYVNIIETQQRTISNLL